MEDYIIKYGRIPKNLDLENILRNVNGNSTKIRYLKEGMVYFISLLVVDNHTILAREDGYRRLKESILSNIIGQKRPSIISKILKDQGVIEVRSYLKGSYSKGYRLTEKYNTGDFKRIELSNRIKDKLHNHFLLTKEYEVELDEQYSFIPLQFEKHRLSFDYSSLDRYINQLGLSLFNMAISISETQQSFTLMKLFNHIGKLMRLKDEIRNRKYHRSFSPSNHRFHSTLTSMPREMRNFLRIDGQEIVEVDISSSQPYILSTILTDDFVNDTNNGFNLFTIYRSLYDSMKSLKSVIPTNKIGNNHYRLGIHFNDDSVDGINNYRDLDFTQDFYTYILNEGRLRNPRYFSANNKTEIGREYIKSHIMTFLFNRNEYQREDSRIVELMRMIFPSLCEFIERFNAYYGNDTFSILLQRSESYLMLGNVCKRINESRDETPYLTIHDSILTNSPNAQIVKDMIFDTISNITGKPLRVRIKEMNSIDEIPNSIIEQTWDKVRVTSEKQYDKIKYSLLQKNIDRGIHILPKEDRNYWRSVMNKGYH